MDEIDCGSGGGQLARTAVSLSALLGKPVRLFNIRKNRPTPGLKAQHLAGLDAVRELCDGRLEGAKMGSESIRFHPGKIMGGHLKVKIPTAGSIGLVLQSVLLPSFFAKTPVELDITGGSTASSWSPPVEYMQNVFLPILAKLGCSAKMDIIRRGYYPAGGAEVKARIEPLDSIKPIEALDNVGVKSISGIVHSAKFLESGKVGERIEASARKAVFDRFGRKANIKLEYSETQSAGCGIVLWANCGNSVIGADVLGERGKKSEDVGRECAQKLAAELAGGGVDSHAGDMLIPYMAIASGKSAIRVPRMTEHIRANASLTEKITGVKFLLDEKGSGVSVDGLSLRRKA